MYHGFFEAHITLNLSHHNTETPQKITDFQEICENLGVKPIYIELERGDTPTQVMTSSLHEGNFEKIKKEVENIAQMLQNNFFQISRMKIEAHPDNMGVPLQNTEILPTQTQNYFECHFKILLNKIFEEKNEKTFEKIFEKLKTICENNKAHLSKNAFKYQENGIEERFVTKRVYGLGKKEAYQSFEELENILIKNDFKIAKKIVEYCVFDDNELVDNNWLVVSNNIISENSPCEVCQKIDVCNFSTFN